MEGDVNGKLEPIEAQISIHALRVEGDNVLFLATIKLSLFLSTPSGWRATTMLGSACRLKIHFYPRPPGGGRPVYPTRAGRACDFYPRPPGGGRLSASARFSMPSPFLSTPSGWRATEIIGIRDQPIPFLSTPSGWRATSGRYSGRSRFRYFYPRPPGGGRLDEFVESVETVGAFLSTPSGWRATSTKP